jgi:hypothetical protein
VDREIFIDASAHMLWATGYAVPATTRKRGFNIRRFAWLANISKSRRRQ